MGNSSPHTSLHVPAALVVDTIEYIVRKIGRKAESMHFQPQGPLNEAKPAMESYFFNNIIHMWIYEMLASFDGISVRIFKDLWKISAIICNIPTAQIENHFKNSEKNFIEIPIQNKLN